MFESLTYMEILDQTVTTSFVYGSWSQQEKAYEAAILDFGGMGT